MCRKLSALAVAITITVCAISALAGDSSTGSTVSIIIPEVLQISVSNDPVVFDLDNPNPGEVYPPPQFPASYTPTADAARTHLVRVFCNHKRNWVISVASGAMDLAGTLSPDHLEWSLDGTQWQSLASTPSTVVWGSQGTGWQEWSIHYRLKLHGDEPDAKRSCRADIVYSVTSSI